MRSFTPKLKHPCHLPPCSTLQPRSWDKECTASSCEGPACPGEAWQGASCLQTANPSTLSLSPPATLRPHLLRLQREAGEGPAPCRLPLHGQDRPRPSSTSLLNHPPPWSRHPLLFLRSSEPRSGPRHPCPRRGCPPLPLHPAPHSASRAAEMRGGRRTHHSPFLHPRRDSRALRDPPPHPLHRWRPPPPPSWWCRRTRR